MEAEAGAAGATRTPRRRRMTESGHRARVGQSAPEGETNGGPIQARCPRWRGVPAGLGRERAFRPEEPLDVMKWEPRLVLLFIGINAMLVLTCLELYHEGQPGGRMVAVGFVSFLACNLTGLLTLRWLRRK